VTPLPEPHFVSQRRVEFADTDMAGIIHFSSYFRYMEECEHAYFRHLGFSVVHRLADGRTLSWPRVRTSCAFYAPVRFEDVLEIRLYVIRKGVKSLTMEFDLFHRETRVARGMFKTVCCLHDHAPGIVSIPIPEELSAQMQETGKPLPPPGGPE